MISLSKVIKTETMWRVYELNEVSLPIFRSLLSTSTLSFSLSFLKQRAFCFIYTHTNLLEVYEKNKRESESSKLYVHPHYGCSRGSSPASGSFNNFKNGSETQFNSRLQLFLYKSFEVIWFELKSNNVFKGEFKVKETKRQDNPSVRVPLLFSNQNETE